MTKLNRFVGVVAAAALAATALVAGTITSADAATKTLVISSDLPLQGASFDSNDSTNKAIELYLKSINYTAGKYKVSFKKYDNATAAAGSWDAAKCAANAQAHVQNKAEVAVMGTYNSGCAKIIVPVLNQDPSGPMLMVSDANTNPGLTKAWEAGEPDIYYPNGTRNYARVCATDDSQGSLAAQFAKNTLGVKSVYVLNDTQTYGQGVAQAFTTEAKKLGMNVLSPGKNGEGWDAKQSDYTSLFTKIKALNPDMIYVGGIYDNNGGQIIKDKVAVLGDNEKVKFMGPDGFTGYPQFNADPNAAGAYLTFPGLTTDIIAKDPKSVGGKFVALYKKTYGKAPVGSYPLYGVAAVQVILAAISKSNGTRKSITSQVFTGNSGGITIPAAQSVLGKAINISGLTGDNTSPDMIVEKVVGGAETTFKVAKLGK